jgi:hypothetical protein
MNIQFETVDVKPEEVRGLIAFLTNLLPISDAPSHYPWLKSGCNYGHSDYVAWQQSGSDQTFFSWMDSSRVPAPPPANEKEAVFGVPAQPIPGLALVQPTAEPAPVDPPKRTRRTKEQIAADEAKQVASSDPTLASAAANAAASDTTQSAPAQPSTADAKPLSAEELRALLNGYIAKHSMEDAIGKLKAFGCNRVTEALSLEPAKLNELVEALRG